MTDLHPLTAPQTLNISLPGDAALLQQWCSSEDAGAMEELIRRHGGMVQGVCRRILGHQPDAEDACQATFLVLVRKANTLSRPAQVAGWLHAVALRVSRKARMLRAKRMGREVAMVDVPAPITPESSEEYRDLRPYLDEELDKLPEKYRVPIVLCELEGLTLQQAASVLGWPKGTVACRLSRGREMLRQRFKRRGLLGCLLFFIGYFLPLDACQASDEWVSSTLSSVIGSEEPTALAIELADSVVINKAAMTGWFTVTILGLALLITLVWCADGAAKQPQVVRLKCGTSSKS